MLRRLGPAINSGRGLFLFGAPGNGKTSIAERVTKAFGQFIWIPRAIGVDGEIIRLYDPNAHEEVPLDGGSGLLNQSHIDRRWIRIRRPTVVVGGELTMSNLEVTLNTSTGISEAPMQLKSNCGTLVIDDFGRQRMSTDELLNRWIVPLEKRYDYLNLANGKKIEVPFDQLVIFSTNLEPRDLVDDAFLRRIPYKIEVVDPTEDEFRELFKMMAPKLGFNYDDKVVDYLLRDALPPDRPADALLPSARSADAGPQHVPVRRVATGPDERRDGLRRRELLRGALTLRGRCRAWLKERDRLGDAVEHVARGAVVAGIPPDDLGLAERAP